MNVYGYQTGVEYFVEKLEYFDIYVVIDGVNGVGGLWVTEKFKRSIETIREQPCSLSIEQTRELLEKIKRHTPPTTEDSDE